MESKLIYEFPILYSKYLPFVFTQASTIGKYEDLKNQYRIDCFFIH
ncbi:MAG: hypothetical protein UU16_C0021G0020 [Candidatus Woesebacteria bacterium GW2011_GWA2_40_7]|uniref:Uncharacterized protein n=2 Tax=Candidatus Woeseibacteriota TaxID=1752722 RepID=A0A0G1FV62_9BACT|nr:MAG: hypothetical protein UU16_C0021G0020 [Candidatus Woesebacteria bacterium GW2011_GWA2_40_7]KKS90653.1 MAG: hypothetical protein UV66_C0001G0010 [Candidatus Woesebacteria bacterium GW2011_GWA1_43_12]